MIKSGLDKGSDDVVSCFLRRRTVKLVVLTHILVAGIR
ncbi:predicted protein [Plenodomus lingam JN3]|uniref:Predicted protein n=1 Tax=Leptosphaeria maculans (strain JN3 / isolate v23.1.3 / race Av1-4-5-6-7-8) TaxID=985895 RepID=E4ZYU9_LEPMJ|nr:predicted protein [Plenodomus lingam JN3]CBX96625.1 predicted protein [Plenodomus lingam JN3]